MVNKTVESTRRQIEGKLYEPLDFYAVRAPLLPLEYYLLVSKELTDCSSTRLFEILEKNSKVNLALAIGNPSLHEALKNSTTTTEENQAKLKRKLLRLLIRMSSRATPFGMYAGVAIGSWSASSTLSLAETGSTIRTRPDMELLSKLALSLEPDLLKHLHVINNPTLSIVGERIYLIERAPILDEENTDGISIEATEEIRKIFSLTGRSISYSDLFQAVKDSTEIEDIDLEDIIFQLVENTFLLTNLRPNTFNVNSGGSLLSSLDKIAAGSDTRDQLGAWIKALQAFDASLPLLICICRRVQTDSPEWHQPFPCREHTANRHGS